MFVGKSQITKLAAFVAIAAVAVFLWAAPVLATAKVATSENGVVGVASGETVDGAAFLAGKTVTIAGTVNGDVYCAAETVHIFGTVEGDVMCGASNLTIEGTVNGDVRVAGSSVIVRGAISGSLTAAAGTIVVDKGAVVQRDALLAASSVRVDGTIERDVRVGGDAVEILGVVGRHVDGGVTNLVVSESAKVGGDVQYWSKSQAIVHEGTVAGKTIQHEPIDHETNPTAAQSLMTVVSGIVFLTILTLGLVLLAPRSVRGATALSLPKLGLSALIGLGAFFIALPLLIILAITVVGLPLALLALVGYVVLFVVALPLVAYYIGRWMLEGRTSSMLLHAIAGGLVLGIVTAIPYIGGFAWLIALVTGMGMAIYSLRYQFRGAKYRDSQTVSNLSQLSETVEFVDASDKPAQPKKTKK